MVQPKLGQSQGCPHRPLKSSGSNEDEFTKTHLHMEDGGKGCAVTEHRAASSSVCVPACVKCVCAACAKEREEGGGGGRRRETMNVCERESSKCQSQAAIPALIHTFGRNVRGRWEREEYGWGLWERAKSGARVSWRDLTSSGGDSGEGEQLISWLEECGAVGVEEARGSRRLMWGWWKLAGAGRGEKRGFPGLWCHRVEASTTKLTPGCPGLPDPYRWGYCTDPDRLSYSWSCDCSPFSKKLHFNTN